MNYAYLLVPILTLLFGGGIGYYLGLYQNRLLNKIRTLEEATPYETEPVVTMGAYESTKEINETDAVTGLVEVKTPQRIEWEAEQAIEKEGRGL